MQHSMLVTLMPSVDTNFPNFQTLEIHRYFIYTIFSQKLFICFSRYTKNSELGSIDPESFPLAHALCDRGLSVSPELGPNA